MSSPPARTPKTADFGALRTDITSTIVKCKSPDAFVNRLDIQTNQATGWESPYVSGFRLYCNDNSPAQPLNWNKPSNGTAYVSVDGAVVNEGINDLIVSHGKYINLVGYGTGTMIGNLKELKVWQQAAQRDYRECLLVGLECTHVSWLDGCRAHFSCLPSSKPAGAANGGATETEATCSSGGGFAIATFAGGIGAGLVVAAALLALLVFVRGRKGPATQKTAAQVENQQASHQPPMQVVTADPYAAVFNGNSSTVPTSQSSLPPSMAAVQYADVHLMSPYNAADLAQQQQQYGQVDSNNKNEWKELPKP